jgi:hypothetical protein
MVDLRFGLQRMIESRFDPAHADTALHQDELVENRAHKVATVMMIAFADHLFDAMDEI